MLQLYKCHSYGGRTYCGRYSLTMNEPLLILNVFSLVSKFYSVRREGECTLAHSQAKEKPAKVICLTAWSHPSGILHPPAECSLAQFLGKKGCYEYSMCSLDQISQGILKIIFALGGDTVSCFHSSSQRVTFWLGHFTKMHSYLLPFTFCTWSRT